MSRSLNKLGRQPVKYRQDLMAEQEVRQEKGDTEPAEDYTFV